jgi:hypothetical protein
MNRLSFSLVVCLLVVATSACGSDTAAPRATIAGNYVATQWVTTGGSGQTNQLLAGSTLELALASNGTTSGHLHVAASGSNPALDADMAGTWTQSNDKVTVSQVADTFVRNLTLNVVPNGSRWSLTADQVISNTRIQLTLDQVFALN